LSLRLGPAAWAAIQAQAQAGYPREVCGILLGRDGRVEEAQACGNLAVDRAHDRYQMDPADQRRIEKGARSRGLEVLGYYHSHPDHPADASATDLALSWQGVNYLIVAVHQGRVADQRLWWRDHDSAVFRRESLEIEA
jgi:proteasome lid subunit RPN8/RPN11